MMFLTSVKMLPSVAASSNAQATKEHKQSKAATGTDEKETRSPRIDL